MAFVKLSGADNGCNTLCRVSRLRYSRNGKHILFLDRISVQHWVIYLHALHENATVLNIFSKSVTPNNTNYYLMHFFPSFSLAESQPHDLQITAYK